MPMSIDYITKKVMLPALTVLALITPSCTDVKGIDEAYNYCRTRSFSKKVYTTEGWLSCEEVIESYEL